MMLRINFSINFLKNLIEEIKKRVDYIILRNDYPISIFKIS